MKTQSETYVAKEEAAVRKPLELYKIWSGSTYWYYTNGDVAVVYDGQTYAPATISRGSAEYNSTLDVNTMKIQFSGISEPAVQYIAQNPIDITWIEISRLFRDQSPLEKSVVFIGQIKTVSFKGVSAEAECVGFEYFLKMQIPLWRYQTTCNHQVFDTGCTLVATGDYAIQATVTLDATKTILTATAFAAWSAYDPTYFVGGMLAYGNERRTMVAQSGSTVTLNFRMISLADNTVVIASPGCDGRIETCRDKFNNVINFLGFPFIPEENPATRIP